MAKPKALQGAPVPNKARRAKSVEAILIAAEPLFVAKGYARTTIDDIAEAAGLTKGAVYFYFKDKEAVLLALLSRAEQLVLDPALDTLTDPDLRPQEKIVRYLHHWAQTSDELRVTMLLHILMSFEFEGSNGAIEHQIDAMYNRVYSALTQLIEDGTKTGEINAYAPPRELAAALISLMDGVLLEWLRRGDTLDGEQLVRGLRMMMLYGLVPAADAAQAPVKAAKPRASRAKKAAS